MRRPVEALIGPVTLTRQPQALFADQDLEQARRQRMLGRDGLPVISRDGDLRGWLTRADLLKALTSKPRSSEQGIEEGEAAAELAVEDPAAAVRTPNTPLRGYDILELRILSDSPARGRLVGEIHWPVGCIVVAVSQRREIHAARPDLELQPGERVIVLAPTSKDEKHERPENGAMGAAPPAQRGGVGSSRG